MCSDKGDGHLRETETLLFIVIFPSKPNRKATLPLWRVTKETAAKIYISRLLRQVAIKVFSSHQEVTKFMERC